MADFLTLDDLVRACRAERAAVVEWVQLGVVRVEGDAPEHWLFDTAEVLQVREIARLANDLDLAPYAAVLVHDLLGERHRLERRVRLLERLLAER
jgi:monomeric isocitrate dehydrogenase